MAIFRCNKCAHLQEQPDGQVGENMACPRCANLAPVYSTMFFISKLLDKYFQGQRDIARLQAPDAKEVSQPQVGAVGDIDLNNTDQLASELSQPA